MGQVKSGGAKKTGRNKVTCQAYKNGNIKNKNKVRKWKKIIKKLLPNNATRQDLELKIKNMGM